MIRCAERHSRILMVGHMWRFDQEVNIVRNAVQSGALGRIVKTKGYGIHVDWGPQGWFVQRSLAGGGALADMGIHAIDTARFILGDPSPAEVFAKIGTCFGDYDVDDTGTVLMTWDTGTVSLIESGWWHPHADGPEAGTQVYGTRGYASLFPTRIRQKTGDQFEESTPPLPTRQEHCDQSMYTRQMEHFVQCVRLHKEPHPGWREGLVNLEIIDAAYRSAQTGSVVPISASGEA
jgi:predicted dehydrogenase